jgi:chromosome partitioning protein
MRRIMVMNAKGGCGKTTLATNIAGHYASKGKRVTLVDFDPQGCSMDWLSKRRKHVPAIRGIHARDPGRHFSENSDVMVFDAPARVHGGELGQLLKITQTVVLPVLPSPIDIDAAKSFLKELQSSTAYKKKQVKVGLIANRVRDNTEMSYELDSFLDKKRLPYVAYLREAMNYIRAFQRGLAVSELPPYLAKQDWKQQKMLFDWLDSAESQP